MIKVNIMYPQQDGKQFDLDYYLNRHFPLVESTFGDLLKDRFVAKGLAGGAPDAPPTYHMIAQMSFASMEDVNEALAKAGPLLADIPNFTDIQPVVQISEVLK